MRKNLCIELLDYQKASSLIKSINPELAHNLKELSNINTAKFIKAEYLFGEKIMREDGVYLPTTNGKTIKTTDQSIPTEFQKLFAEAGAVPVTLVLNKSTEVYQEKPSRVMPTKIFQAGELIGLWELFDSQEVNKEKTIWEVSSGARSLLMIPSISDTYNHSKLSKTYNISSHPPKTLLEHINPFIEIGQTDTSWKTSVLFFVGGFWKKTFFKKNPPLVNSYLLKQAWEQSLNCRYLMDYTLCWESFLTAVDKLKLNINTYLINTIKHLYLISKEVFPGFAPTIDKTTCPLFTIERAYRDVYSRENFAPIIMSPKFITNEQSVYYSMKFPTLLEWVEIPKYKTGVSIIRQIKELLDLLLETMPNLNTTFHFYHIKPDNDKAINSPCSIPLNDPYFSKALARFPEHTLAQNSSFFKGCIQIVRRES